MGSDKARDIFISKEKCMNIRTAILVDGAFYRKRAYNLFGDKTPKERANELEYYCSRHIKEEKIDRCYLYRIFYYDCPPMEKMVYHPLLKKAIDFSKTKDYTWANDFFEELSHKRKFALRLGQLASEQAYFNLKNDSTRKLMNGSLKLEDLTSDDFSINVTQKGVDMRIGLDISSLAFKKQVDRIILISGDSDFVPAAKQARREGIDFILDPMRSPIKKDLYTHIDGIRTKAPKKAE